MSILKNKKLYESQFCLLLSNKKDTHKYQQKVYLKGLSCKICVFLRNKNMSMKGKKAFERFKGKY